MSPVAGTAHPVGAHGPVPPANPHGGYNLMMYEQDFHNTRSTEMTKFIRGHFKTPKARPYRLENVRCRTNTIRIAERTTSVWRSNYVRRRDHLKRGFNTPPQRPYNPIGDIQLNSQRLLLNTLADALPAKLPVQSMTSRFGRREQKPSPIKVEQPKTVIQEPATKDRVDPDADEILRERALATAGFAYIRQRLDESEAVLRAERGGQSFEKSIKKIKDLKKQQSELDRKMSALALNAPALGQWSPSASPSSTPGPGAKRKLQNVADMERRSQGRRKRLWLGKAQCILKILNALHNIKSRDLRSRVPMSHDQVNHVYRDVMWEKPAAAASQARPVASTRLQHHQAATMDAATRANSSADTMSSGDVMQQPPLGNIKSSKPALPSSIRSTVSVQGKAPGPGTTPRDVQSSPTPAPFTAPWKKFGYHANMRKGFRLERENRMDTWEDLMAPASPSNLKRNSVLPNLLQMQHTGNAVLRWHQHHLDHKQKQPYWMNVGVSSEDKMKRSAQANAAKSKGNPDTDDPDAEETLQALKQSFKKAQKKLAREALQDLERLERDRQRVIKQKFQVITESPIFERTVLSLKAARTHYGGPVISADDDSEIKLSPWYMELKSTIEAVLGKYDPDVVSIFNMLSHFSLEDGKSIPNAKERLCLLVMSMPASDILTIPMQLAILFVLEEILWAHPKALAQWLNHRKVPLVVDIDMQSTA